jgi:hypothetical protein
MNITKGELLQKKKKKQKKRKYIIFSILFFIFCILGILFFSIPYFHIKKVIVVGEETIVPGSTEHIVQETLQGRYALVFPKKNVFLIKKKKLVYILRATFPEIDTIHIRKHFHSLNITIAERKPSTVWCMDTRSDCYFVHNDGTIFALAGKVSNPLFFVYYTPLQDTVEPIGALLLPKEKFDRVERIRKTMNEYGVKMYGYTMASDHEEYLYITPIQHGQKSAYIKSRTDQNTETILSNLMTVLKSDELLQEKNNHFNNTEYIDLRFDGKVFYKLLSSS